jgi:serine protease DegQ
MYMPPVPVWSLMPRAGLIVTNHHVIRSAERITVRLADGRELDAEKVGGDPDTDVAIIKVEVGNMTAIQLGDSDSLEVGESVLAIGNPLRLGQTVTSGIVSGLHRSNIGIERYEDFIQTDAAIYPGNSGGALVNLQGPLVGINTAFIGAGKANPGLGFAIPLKMVRAIVYQILEYGEVRRGGLGVTLEDPTSREDASTVATLTLYPAFPRISPAAFALS